MMKTDAIGLYIHIPFCKKKCGYCDFCSYEACDAKTVDAYVERLCTELSEYKRNIPISVNTVFFGGGTPSLINEEHIDKILNTVKEIFRLEENSEITIEVNPGCASYEKLSAYRSYGINRLSIGLQSIHENELKILGRIHTYNDFLSTYNSARDVGFTNINVDLMYGIPFQTKESLSSTLKNIIALNPEHLSLYSLILEDGTPIAENASTLHIPDDDTVSSMYEFCNKLLADAGFSHYEISNYAKSGFECKHNLKYWQNGEFIGVGLSAYSYFEKCRYGNFGSKDNIICLNEYISSPSVKKSHNELLDKSTEMQDFIMLALRTKYGVNYHQFKENFGISFKDNYSELINKYVRLGLAEDSGHSFSLTENGFFVSNTVICDFI